MLLVRSHLRVLTSITAEALMYLVPAVEGGAKYTSTLSLCLQYKAR